MVLTRSKRAKQILRCLSAAQHEDRVLGFSITQLIRYNLLHNYHRCIQVSVDLGEPSDRFPCHFPFDAMPRFLRSQLAAQKIADGSRLWSQVAPLLTFIQTNLRRLGKPRGFPTLFVWQSRENHRSYFFFAFVELKMVSKTYTARELLCMRNLSPAKEFFIRLSEKFRKETGLGDIFRMPTEGPLPLIREEEADASGNLGDVSAKGVATRQLDGTDSEWKYRGRTESEEDMPHPICSPVGLAAQKDEGFQRFYKAVVSPTHVRVTAGGRIVPNTRGSSSPTAKWAKDKAAAGDGAFSSRAASRDQLEHGPFPFAIPQSPYGAFPPMMPGFAHGMPPGMPAGPPPFPMMPWQMGVNMAGAFGMAHPHMAQMLGPLPGAKNSAASLKGDKHSEAGNSENSSSVRISPPEQFDHSRPFFYNGQWMMPPGAAMYPFGMPPVVGFPFGQPVMQPRFGVHPMMHLHAMKPDQSANSHASSSSGIAAYAGASNPPVSSIRQSEITKRQLENLRGHLKYAEDQFQYNKHQIYEKLVEQQTEVLREQIHMFEKNLEAQLSQEENRHPKSDKVEESNSSTSSRDGLGSKSSTGSDTKPGHDSRSVSTSQDETPNARIVKGQKGKDRVSSQLPSGAKPMPLKSALKKPRPSEPARKPSTLLVTAALAPPFQPRTDGAASVSAATDSSLCSAGPSASSEACRRNVDTEDHARKPYLVGTLPRGCNPAAARDTDYTYGRDLTEDELRARHMYWGNAPRNLQKGYPKFDGKEFYPPSPAKGGSTESAATSSPSIRRRIQSGNSQTDYGLDTAKAESDPFASVGRSSQRLARNNHAQSEHLPRPEPSTTSTSSAAKQSPRKGASQAGRSYDDFRKALGENGQFSGGCKDKSSSESGDDANILFKGRRQVSVSKSKNSNEIWNTMLKKGKSSGAAVPGIVSSMTARGVLPNYAGHATASLTPTIANTSVSPKGASCKPGEPGDAESAKPDEKKVENRPPNGASVKGSLRRAGC